MWAVFWTMFGLLMAACTGLKTVRWQMPASTKPDPIVQGRHQAKCNSWTGYLPDMSRPEWLPPRILRVNFHVLNKRDSSANFREAEGRVFCKKLLEAANADLDTNIRNWRSPEGTTVLRKNYRYQIQPQTGDDGIYFHYDDTLYYFVSSGKNQNNYDRRVVEKYGIGRDSILNIFIQVHPEDSCKSKTYRANGQGIALGTALKMAGLYESKGAPENFRGLMNHEIGHILSLSHAWSEDGCPDTQNHPNRCWVWTEEGPCRDQATNNVMDYNAYQLALTPCQIGRIQQQMASEKSAVRKCLLPTWCQRNPARDVTVRDSVTWSGARDLEGNLTIAPGGVLELKCRLSLPADCRILVQAGGELWLRGARLHNACGRTWKGIFVETNGAKKGRVEAEGNVAMDNL